MCGIMDKRELTDLSMQNIERLQRSIEDAKRLKAELDRRTVELSKLIESAEALRDRGMRSISGSDSEE